MASREEIVRYLDELLEPARFEDMGPNGLQVPGAETVTEVVTGVSAQLELFEAAASRPGALVLCHHGMFWNFQPRSIDETVKRRLRTLFDADLSLAAYHLPLDAHPEVGNNALICSELGLERAEPFGEAGGATIGWIARSPGGVPATKLRERCARLFGQEPFVWETGPDVVHSVGIVSGAAASMFRAAASAGLDAFLTGEPAEHTMADAREYGVHFIGAGHYATETLGVRRLGELLAERFGLQHRFVPIPNPL